MMRFTFTEQPAFLPDPNDPIYCLEHAVDHMDELSPKQRLSLLYNDAKNYIDMGLTPFDAWQQKRLSILQGYAGLDWLAFGQHLNPKSPTLGNLCTTIYRQLQELVKTSETHPIPFPLPLFCSTMAKIDHLWHILLPSHLVEIQDPAIHTLLAYCGHA